MRVNSERSCLLPKLLSAMVSKRMMLHIQARDSKLIHQEEEEHGHHNQETITQQASPLINEVLFKQFSILIPMKEFEVQSRLFI